MKFIIKMILLLSLLLFITAQAETTVNSELSTDDKENIAILNSLGPVDILNLSGQDAGNDVECFKIISLPDPSSGILYLEDGETEVEVGQFLSIDEANCLKFDPNPNFVGDATFQYASVNSDDVVDPNPATFNIPIYTEDNPTPTSTPSDNNDSSSPNDNNDSCACNDYSSSVPSLSLWGVFVMLMLTLIITREELNRDF